MKTHDLSDADCLSLVRATAELERRAREINQRHQTEATAEIKALQANVMQTLPRAMLAAASVEAPSVETAINFDVESGTLFWS